MGGSVNNRPPQTDREALTFFSREFPDAVDEYNRRRAVGATPESASIQALNWLMEQRRREIAGWLNRN